MALLCDRRATTVQVLGVGIYKYWRAAVKESKEIEVLVTSRQN